MARVSEIEAELENKSARLEVALSAAVDVQKNVDRLVLNVEDLRAELTVARRTVSEKIEELAARARRRIPRS